MIKVIWKSSYGPSGDQKFQFSPQPPKQKKVEQGNAAHVILALT